MSDDMVTKKEWKEFRSTGLFLIVNQLLHVFGWALVMEFDTKGKMTTVFPARVKYRGFTDDVQTKGYQMVLKYLKENIEELEKESLS